MAAYNEMDLNISEAPLFSEEAKKGLYAHAYQLYEAGKYEDATGFFRFLTTVEMSRKRNWIGLGASLQMIMSYDKAVEAFAFASLLDQKDPQPHIYAAECLFALGKIPEGTEALAFAKKLAATQDNKNEVNSRITLLQNAWCGEKNKQ